MKFSLPKKKEKSKVGILTICKRVIMVFIVGGFFICGIGTMGSAYSIESNTRNLTYDFSAVRVVSISNTDELLLSGGEIVKSEEVKLYSKVSQGAGTWYIKENSCLVTEVTNDDIVSIYKLFFVYTLLSFYVIFKGIKDKWLWGTKWGKLFLVAYVFWLLDLYVVVLQKLM